jgi:HK97 family phage prohead protease
MSLETRLYKPTFEIRKTAEGTKIGGYAARFNTLSSNLGGFREQIAPGAFATTLRDNTDVFLLYGHEQNSVLARTTAGTLNVREDATGLRFDATLPNTTLGRDVAENLNNGNLDEMSFGFNTDEDSWEQNAGAVIRTLRAVTLAEISIVPRGAYGQAAKVSLRSAPAEIRSLLDDVFGDILGDDDDSDDDDIDPLTGKKKKKSDDDDDTDDISDGDRSLFYDGELAIILAKRRMQF